jgi:SAM-dependent methyltransferase
VRSPSLTRNRAQAKNLAELRRLLSANPAPQRILVVGAGDAGRLFEVDGAEWVLTDVVSFPGIDVLCDAQELPFENETFDAAIAIAVLEHVPDPNQAAGEIYRVLRPDGLVYAETPFLQQVHMGAWDFTRFTALGHRRVFRMFDALPAETVVAGPASSLAWALHGVVVAAIGRNRLLWRAAHHGANFLFFWLPYLDPIFARGGASDAACGTAFLGRKRATAVPDDEIIASYAGSVPTPRSDLAAP